MLAEDQSLTSMYLDEATKAEQKRMEEENKEDRQRKIDEKWREYVAEAANVKLDVIKQLNDAAEMRGSKKGRKGRKGKGKGKKGKK